MLLKQKGKHLDTGYVSDSLLAEKSSCTVFQVLGYDFLSGFVVTICLDNAKYSEMP